MKIHQAQQTNRFILAFLAAELSAWRKGGTVPKYVVGDTITGFRTATGREVWSVFLCFLAVVFLFSCGHSPKEKAEADAGTEAGTNAGTEAGTNAGTEAATDAATNAGTEAATNAGTEAGTKAGTEVGPSSLKLYTLTFDLNGGSGTIPKPLPQAQEGEALKLPSSDGMTAPSGKVFAGWAKTKEGLPADQEKSNTYTPKQDTILYAQWSDSLWALSFDLNQGTGTKPKDIKQTLVGQALDLPDGNLLKKQDYKFEGWSTAQDGKNVLSSGKCAPIKDMILYAVWVPDFYAVKFDANGGDGVQAEIMQKSVSEELTLPAGNEVVFKKANHAFDGWATDKEGSQKLAKYRPMSDTTLYAVWKKTHFTVSFNPTAFTEGTLPASITQKSVGEEITLPGGTGFSRKGYDFDGWWSGGLIQSPYRPTKDIALYPNWKGDGKTLFTVKFSDAVPITQTTYGEAIELPPCSTGRRACGWSLYHWKLWNSETMDYDSYAEGQLFTPKYDAHFEWSL